MKIKNDLRQSDRGNMPAEGVVRPLHYPENVGDRCDWGLRRTSGRAGVAKSRVPSTKWGLT
jgi:hypothetical protein